MRKIFLIIGLIILSGQLANALTTSRETEVAQTDAKGLTIQSAKNESQEKLVLEAACNEVNRQIDSRVWNEDKPHIVRVRILDSVENNFRTVYLVAVTVENQHFQQQILHLVVNIEKSADTEIGN